MLYVVVDLHVPIQVRRRISDILLYFCKSLTVHFVLKTIFFVSKSMLNLVSVL